MLKLGSTKFIVVTAYDSRGREVIRTVINPSRDNMRQETVAWSEDPVTVIEGTRGRVFYVRESIERLLGRWQNGHVEEGPSLCC